MNLFFKYNQHPFFAQFLYLKVNFYKVCDILVSKNVKMTKNSRKIKFAKTKLIKGKKSKKNKVFNSQIIVCNYYNYLIT